MIKVIWAADREAGLSDEEFDGWWHEVHGLQEFGLTSVRRYIQHPTLPEARGGAGGVAPTRDGASIGWYDDYAQYLDAFARARRDLWGPLRFAPQMDVVIAEERAVVEGATSPGMVKLIAIARRHPSLSMEEFQRAWFEDHGPRWARIPGVRRSVQNHPLPEVLADPNRRTTHDGWSEDWFDSLEELRRALESPEAQEARAQSADLFERPLSIVIARERTIVP